MLQFIFDELVASQFGEQVIKRIFPTHSFFGFTYFEQNASYQQGHRCCVLPTTYFERCTVHITHATSRLTLSHRYSFQTEGRTHLSPGEGGQQSKVIETSFFRKHDL